MRLTRLQAIRRLQSRGLPFEIRCGASHWWTVSCFMPPSGDMVDGSWRIAPGASTMRQALINACEMLWGPR